MSFEGPTDCYMHQLRLPDNVYVSRAEKLSRQARLPHVRPATIMGFTVTIRSCQQVRIRIYHSLIQPRLTSVYSLSDPGVANEICDMR